MTGKYYFGFTIENTLFGKIFNATKLHNPYDK